MSLPEEVRARVRNAKEGEHMEFRFRETDAYLCCARCGHVKPRTGWTTPCRGQVRIGLREDGGA